jgi:hypothetical protein
VISITNIETRRLEFQLLKTLVGENLLILGYDKCS